MRRCECRRTRRSCECGLLSTELVIIMPIMLLIALLAVFVVHVGRHSSRAQQAADAGARAASFTTNQPDALAAAHAAASSVCRGTVNISVMDFDPPELATFTPGRAAVVLTCTESFTGFSPLVSDSTRTESGIAVAAIEYWLADP